MYDPSLPQACTLYVSELDLDTLGHLDTQLITNNALWNIRAR